MAKTPKKRNPNDATNRNVRAANKKIAALEKRLFTVQARQVRESVVFDSRIARAYAIALFVESLLESLAKRVKKLEAKR